MTTSNKQKLAQALNCTEKDIDEALRIKKEVGMPVVLCFNLGTKLGEGKALSEQLAGRLEAVHKSIAALKKAKVKFAPRNCPNRAAVIDGMVKSGVAVKTATNYATLIIKHCIEGSRAFSFDLAAKLAKENGKKKEETKAPTTTELPPAPDMGAANPTAGLTAGQTKQIAGEPGNNGEPVQKAPSNEWHRATVARYDSTLNVLMQLQAELKQRGLTSHAGALGNVHKALIEAKRELEVAFKEAKAI